MNQTYNVYCDESCHLENDGQSAMVLGAVWSPLSKRLEIAQRIRDIKIKHDLKPDFEIKWTKVSQSKVNFYLDIIDYFFDNDDLHFRGLIAGKSKLNHQRFAQTHDDWYYKLYFTMLKVIFEPQSQYRVYIDIKDTLGAKKISTLHNTLCNNAYDFSRNLLERVQQIHSDESPHLQVADLLIGALSYLHRNIHSSRAKLLVIQRIKERSGYKLTHNTLQRENKFNLLVWQSNYDG